MKNHQWSGRTEGTDSSLKRLNLLLGCVNIRVIYFILPIVAIYYMLFARDRAKSIYSYFRIRRNYSSVKSLYATYKNHLIFAKNFIDRFYVFAGKHKRFVIDDNQTEEFVKYLNSKEPLIILSAHIGNYEISSYIGGKTERGIKVIAFGNESLQLQKLRATNMAKNNISIISVNDDISHIFEISEALNKGEAITLTADRILTGNKIESYPFLGGKALFPIGIYHIAQIYKAKILTMFVMREKKNFHYKLILKPLEIDSSIKGRNEIAKEYGKAFVKTLEETLELYPYQWFNFYNFWEKGA